MHNRPRDVVSHIMKRIFSTLTKENITRCGDALSSVRSECRGDGCYKEWLGRGDSLPGCTCEDWRRHKLPCKHLCAIIQHMGVSWQALGETYWKNPLLALDEMCLSTSFELSTDMPEEILDEGSDDLSTVEGVEQCESNPHYDHLPARRRSRRTRLIHQCTDTIKSLTDTAYLLKDCEYLEELNSTYCMMCCWKLLFAFHAKKECQYCKHPENENSQRQELKKPQRG